MKRNKSRQEGKENAMDIIKLLLLSLILILIVITVVNIFYKGRNLHHVRVSFYYGIFLISFISVVYLLIIQPTLSTVMFFTLSVIEMFLVGYLMIAWGMKRMRAKLTTAITFLSVWWLVSFVLYFIFG